MESSQEESGHWIISQGSQANKGGKQPRQDLGWGLQAWRWLLGRNDSPSLSSDACFLYAQASLRDARPPAPIYQVSVGIQGLVP